MAIEYLDFELEIGQGDGVTFPLSVVRSPAGVARGEFNFPLRTVELDNRLKSLQIALLRSGGRRRKALTTHEQTVQEFGRELFALLFHNDVRSLYFQSRSIADSRNMGLRLKLRVVSPELATLPWEFLFDDREGDYLCLSDATPVVRYLEVPQSPRPLTVTTPIRILGMVASPKVAQKLDVDLEKQLLEEAVADLQEQGLVELVWLEGDTWRDLQRAMRPNRGPWHVFHFIGHGGYNRQTDEGFLVLSRTDGDPYILTATKLGQMLGGHRTLRLAILNACEGAQSSRDDIFSGAAATLVRRGIPAVIAMQYEITDDAAIEFSQQFYDALADGLPVDYAVTAARKSINFAVNNSLEWGIPVLFMQAADGVLFEVESSAKQQQDDKAEKPSADAPAPSGGTTVNVYGSGAVAVGGGVAAGEGGTAIGGDFVGGDQGADESDDLPDRDSDAETPAPKEPDRVPPATTDRLTGSQIRELLAALLDAYSEPDLRRMVRFDLDENLDVIAGGSNLSDKVFNLISWAERTGRIREMVEKAHRFNPGNQELRAFAESIGVPQVKAPEAEQE